MEMMTNYYVFDISLFFIKWERAIPFTIHVDMTCCCVGVECDAKLYIRN